jgi:GT2 family glycosyltransferase
LASLSPSAESGTESLDYEVVVVDNASTDGTAQMVSEDFTWVRFIVLEQNYGFSVATNRAASEAQGDVFILLNPDASLTVDQLQYIRQVVLNEKNTIVGVRQIDERGQLQLSIGGRPRFGDEVLRHFLQRAFDRDWTGARFLVDRVLDRRVEVPWVSGACMAMEAGVYRALGGMDEEYFLFFEDIDFCVRAGRAGYKIVYEPSVTVFHRRGYSASQNPGAAREAYLKSRERFWNSHGNFLSRKLMTIWAKIH